MKLCIRIAMIFPHETHSSWMQAAVEAVRPWLSGFGHLLGFEIKSLVVSWMLLPREGPVPFFSQRWKRCKATTPAEIVFFSLVRLL